MSRKQLSALFLCRLVVWGVGSGLLPILPVYATQLGAEPAVVGYYLSFAFLALVMGSVIAGWFSDRFHRRKPLIIVTAVICIPAYWLMGQVTNIWYLLILTAIVWFFAGIGISLTFILAGLFAAPHERGKVFGILELTGGLGPLIGGLSIGPLVDRWGFQTMFLIVALVWILYPAFAFRLEDKAVVRAVKAHKGASTGRVSRLGGAFTFLLVAGLIANTSGFVGNLGIPLTMSELDFAATAISSTAAVGGLVILPLPFLLGWLSDRVERKHLLAVVYFAGAIGLLILTMSTSLWQFWIVAALIYLVQSINRGIGSALVVDLVREESLGTGLSLFNAVLWGGGVIGYAGTGYAIQTLGGTTTFSTGILLLFVAIIFLTLVRQSRQPIVVQA